MVFVVQISVSNKSYGCVDNFHAKEIVKNSYFECFPAVLYLSFIRYHPVYDIGIFKFSILITYRELFGICYFPLIYCTGNFIMLTFRDNLDKLINKIQNSMSIDLGLRTG